MSAFRVELNRVHHHHVDEFARLLVVVERVEAKRRVFDDSHRELEVEIASEPVERVGAVGVAECVFECVELGLVEVVGAAARVVLGRVGVSVQLVQVFDELRAAADVACRVEVDGVGAFAEFVEVGVEGLVEEEELGLVVGFFVEDG